MKKSYIFLAIVIGLILIVGVSLISFNNGLVRGREGIDAQMAQVNNMLLNRSDRIPGLVNAVKGYAKHENEIFTNLANARNRLLAAEGPDRVQAGNAFDSALGRLLMLVENYPQLKADALFSKFMDEYSGTQNRVNFERMKYNRLVQDYNAKIKQFPGSIFAGTFGFAQRDYYDVPETAKENVVPQF